MDVQVRTDIVNAFIEKYMYTFAEEFDKVPYVPSSFVKTSIHEQGSPEHW